jgi:AmmeMemoRadiSam system protein A
MPSSDGGTDAAGGAAPRAARAPGERRALLDVAHASIEHGIRHGRALRVDPTAYPEALREVRATFVTLYREGRLRGCVGTLEARQPLVADVAESAWGAAFRDPRFEGLRHGELAGLEISISVLGSLEPLRAASEAELVARLRPGVDGLLLREGPRRGTLLPAVWRHVSDARDFVREVKRKAGLPEDHWSVALEAFRYEVESIPD